MTKRIVTKGIALGLIFLFFVISITPILNGKVEPDKKDIQKKEPRQMFFNAPPEEEWNKTFGGILDDAAYDVQQTQDGGFIIGGYTRSFGIALWSPWLIKTDSKGNEQWNKTYNYYSLSNLSGSIQSVQQTNDGGFILGCTFSIATLPILKDVSPLDSPKRGYQSLMVMVLIKTDSNGNEEWNKTYPGVEYSNCFRVLQTTDGGFIATGGGNSTSNGYFYVYLLKTHPNGTMQWLKTYGTSDMGEEGRWVQQTFDRGYIIAGMSDCNYDTDWGKIWLIKTDVNGTMVWNKKFEGTFRNPCIGPETYGNSIQQTFDSGFIIAGVIDNQGCLIKTDSNGNEIWRKTPFLNDYSFFCFSGKQTSDGGYIATGNGLIKTDTEGNEQWNITIPTPFTSGEETSDGGYIITGSTSGYYNGDVWLIKFEPEEELPKITFNITGGLGLHLKITNNGIINASGVTWQIIVNGGILGLINFTVDGTVDIARDESKTVKTPILFGLGDIQIIASVDEVTKTAGGTQFLIFTLLKNKPFHS